MPTDPFQHFGEQQRSWELLEHHKATLLAEAQELLRGHPDAEVVGLIVDADAAEAAAFHAAVEQATGSTTGPAGRSDARRGFLGVVPRDFVVAILRANVPAALDWLPPSRTTAGTRVLPLCAATRSGYRFGHIVCEA